MYTVINTISLKHNHDSCKAKKTAGYINDNLMNSSISDHWF